MQMHVHLLTSFLLSEITSFWNLEPFRQNHVVQNYCFFQEDMISYTGHTEDTDLLHLPVAFKFYEITHTLQAKHGVRFCHNNYIRTIYSFNQTEGRMNLSGRK